MTQPSFRLRAAALSLLTVLLGGCAVPDSMHVREGGSPRHADEDVLFRTTYFFRVFDLCSETNQEAPNDKQILSDSLYRFRMTGKGQSGIDKVRFESGTLKAWQLDPFGSSVEFDKDGKPYFVSAQKRDELHRIKALEGELDESHRIKALEGELERLLNLRKNKPLQTEESAIISENIRAVLKLMRVAEPPQGMAQAQSNTAQALTDFALGLTAKGGNNTDKQALKNQQTELSKVVDQLRNARTPLDLVVALDAGLAQVEGPQALAKVTANTKRREALVKILEAARQSQFPSPSAQQAAADGVVSPLVCGNGLPARRGFQVLGPEGWRTLDQDDRLVLAMSASGKPLFDALKEISKRVMGKKASSASTLQEQLSLQRARASLASLTGATPDNLAERLDAVLAAYRQEGN